jgi:cell division protein FtsB
MTDLFPMYRIPKFVWITLLIALVLFLFFPSVSQFLELKRQEEGLSREIADLRKKITELKREEHLIKNDLSYLEGVIRKELGLVKPGEIVYKVVPEEVGE